LASLKEEIKAGTIILISLILLSGFIILIGGSPFFEKVDKYYVRVRDVAGLDVGAQVKLGGLRIGRVLKIEAPSGPGQPITVEIGIKQGTVLYKGTQALITQVGLVGDTYLLLSIEKTANERFRVGETIPAEEQIQFAKILARVDDIAKSIDGLISDIGKIFSQKNVMGIEKVIENTNRTVVSASSSIDQIVAALKNTTDNLGRVLDEAGGLVRDNRGEVSTAIKKARESIEKLEGDIEKAGDAIKAFEETVKAFEETAKNLSKTSDSIDKAVVLQSQNLDQFLNLLIKATQDLQDLIQELKTKPWRLLYKEGKGKGE
jgi:phospholipid/cholesterol/gamma-HCH transport system substrate-binding protein